MTSLMQRI